MPTLKQERLAEALLDPSIPTKTAAILAAGYSASSAATNQGRLTRMAGVQHAKRALVEARSDRARLIVAKGSDLVLDRIEDKTISDAGAVMAIKAAHEMQQGEPESETRFLPPSYLRDRRRRKAMRHVMTGIRIALRALDEGTIDALRAAMAQPPRVTPDEVP